MPAGMAKREHETIPDAFEQSVVVLVNSYQSVVERNTADDDARTESAV